MHVVGIFVISLATVCGSGGSDAAVAVKTKASGNVMK